jgi:molecular chaperone DnaK
VLKGDLETKIEAVKKALETEDADTIKAAADELAQSSHKLAEQLYAQKQAEPGPGAEASGAAGGAKPADDNVVDADYTEVK